MSESRPFEQEITTLVGHIATALDLPPETVIGLLEAGDLNLSMGSDDNGNRYVAVAHGVGSTRREARIYKDAIHHRGAPPEATAAPGSPEEP